MIVGEGADMFLVGVEVFEEGDEDLEDMIL